MSKNYGKAPLISRPNAPKIPSNSKAAVPRKGQNSNNKMGANIPNAKIKPTSQTQDGFSKLHKGDMPYQESKLPCQSNSSLAIKRRRSIAINCKYLTNYRKTLKYFWYQGMDKASDYVEIYYPKEKGYIKKRMQTPFQGDFFVHDHYLYVFGNILVRLDMNDYCNEVKNMNKQISKHWASLCSDSNGIIYYLCGSIIIDFHPDKRCEKYNSATDTWTNLPPHEKGGGSQSITSKRFLYLWQDSSDALYKLSLNNCETAQWERFKVNFEISCFQNYQMQFICPHRLLIVGGRNSEDMRLCYYNEDTHKSGTLESSLKSYWINYLMKENNGMNMWNALQSHNSKKWNYDSLPQQFISTKNKAAIEVWQSAVGPA